MNRAAGNSRRWTIRRTTALAIAMAVGAAGIWEMAVRIANRRIPAQRVASDELVSSFFKSLAALDVGENELAARILTKSVQLEPREPAFWTNLAVAHLRLQDLERARETLEHASSLAGNCDAIAVLQAELLAQSGEVEPAIEQLRQVHERRPSDLVVAYSLASLLGQLRSEGADHERLSLLSKIVESVPDNLRARSEQARLAAALGRAEEFRASLRALSHTVLGSSAVRGPSAVRGSPDPARAVHGSHPNAVRGSHPNAVRGSHPSAVRGSPDPARASPTGPVWPDAAQQYLVQAQQAAANDDFHGAARSLTFFENLIKPLPEYQQSLQQLGMSSASAIGTPLRRFVRLKLPSLEAAEADRHLTFDFQSFPHTAARPDLVLAVAQAGERRSTLLSLSGSTLQAGDSAALPFPGSSNQRNPASIAAADVDSDFRQDLILAGPEGCRMHLEQHDGSFSAQPMSPGELAQPWRSVWAVDIEADGDLDVLLSDHVSPLRCLRNNGDVTFTPVSGVVQAAGVCQLLAVDLDSDGDVDLATLDASGSVVVWQNERGGVFAAVQTPLDHSCLALAAGDTDRDGRFDLVSLMTTGEIRQATWMPDLTWSETRLAAWSPPDRLAGRAAGETRLDIADMDNNGAVDVVATIPYRTAVWLRGASGNWTPLAESPPMFVTSVVDVNADGLLDLVGLTEKHGCVALNQSRAGYQWHVIQPLASVNPGDKRINSFGIGGRIEIRAGNLVQAAMIRSPQVHFGLGRHKHVDVARIVWPNGIVQGEFELRAGEALVARQRLAGSCPWVFAFDGDDFRFIKDFLWRSPLGVRLNDYQIEDVMQTEDRIKIPGQRLAETNGRYFIRITAELWETYFVDHVDLLAVDHPGDTEVFVDERFVPGGVPDYRNIVATAPQPLQNVVDHRAHRLDKVLQAIDGMYADRVALSDYRGLAEEHWIEFDFPSTVDPDRQVLLIGHGWVYPSDSSVNVAMAQRQVPRPYGLILEQRCPDGNWRTLRDNLGFPGGKNKDVIIRVPSESLATSRHFRLRTNMEIYWDSLGFSYPITDVSPRVRPLPMERAELRYRGFSQLLPVDRRRPDTPIYDVEATGQRWLDLEGFYTRFGDVAELLGFVDDRYVVMNTGDELALDFGAVADVPDGWRRDFVLVGDGWVKDGDFNTAFSQWVLPLPAHERRAYTGPLLPLQRDPVYLRHANDWHRFHTRYVTPRRMHGALWTWSPNQPADQHEP